MKVFNYVQFLLLLIPQCLLLKVNHKNCRIRKTEDELSFNSKKEKLNSLIELDAIKQKDLIVQQYFDIMSFPFSIGSDERIIDNLLENFNYIKTQNAMKDKAYNLGLTNLSIFLPEDLVKAYNYVILQKEINDINYLERKEIKYLFSMLRENTSKSLINLLKLDCERYFKGDKKNQKEKIESIKCHPSKKLNYKNYEGRSHRVSFIKALASKNQLEFDISINENKSTSLFTFKDFLNSKDDNYSQFIINEKKSNSYQNNIEKYSSLNYKMLWHSIEAIEKYYIPFSTYIYFTNYHELQNFMNYKDGYFRVSSSKAEDKESIIFRINVIITGSDHSKVFLNAKTSFDTIWGKDSEIKISNRIVVEDKKANDNKENIRVYNKTYNFSLLSTDAIFIGRSNIRLEDIKKIKS